MEKVDNEVQANTVKLSGRVVARQQQMGQRVRGLRKAKGYTQAELVERLERYDVDMHSTTLAKLESGGRPTTAHELWALASVLGCEYTHLLPTPVDLDDDGDVLAAAKEAVLLAQAKVDDLQETYATAGQALARAVLELRAAEAARDDQARRYLSELGRGAKVGNQ